MTGQLALVAVLVMAAYWIGFSVGRANGRVDAMRWWQRVGRMGQMMQDTSIDQPGNPRLN